jgi:radical SAM family uncharacterized protein/radical SAM-linked protein
MSKKTIQDILPLVQMPSRYLGCETNQIKKSWDETQLHVALAFPDLYEIGTSHFGIQIIYGMLNDREDILAERVFSPAVDMEAQLRKNNIPLSTLESATPLNKFDIVGFSLLYELNYTNMINMLDLAGIPFFAETRTEKDPFVIAGGPCTCNPEPVADFFDAIVVGDGEAVILQLTDAWIAWQQSGSRDREDLLQRWSQIIGVYIPSFFDFSVDAQGKQRLKPKHAHHLRIERAVVADLNDAPFPSRPVIPFGRPVHDRLRMEIARGCTRGCRFCQAGIIYRPVRERRPEAVIKSVKQSLKDTGYEDLSLLSLSTGDYSCIAALMKKIMQFGEKDRIAVSLPSLRAGSLTPELMELIKRVRKTGFTIAPEAGSQRLRDAINKNISEADIFETVKNAFDLGWNVIKLYFMIGLPTETRDDIEAIVDLAKRLKTVADQKRRGAKINVSIATFVPKPHTPFQWEPQIGLGEALQKMEWLRENLKLPGLQIKFQDPHVSMIEGIWARGDRRLAKVLESAWNKGCRFDGWSDYFDFERWLIVLNDCGIQVDNYADGFQDTNQSLPWNHIDIGVKRSFLLKERERAKTGSPTADCRTGDCSGCGVCDFKFLKPVSFPDRNRNEPAELSSGASDHLNNSIKYVINYNKMKNARFLGHLEMAKLFTRSMRRANIPLKYSAGFHPMPKISFKDTLPMGMQSEYEEMMITLTESMNPKELVRQVRQQLPEGLDITACRPFDPLNSWMEEYAQQYHIELKDGFLKQNDLDIFLGQASMTIERKSKKGKRISVDLKKSVSGIDLLDGRHANMRLVKEGNHTVRPAHVLKAVFKLSERQILSAIVTKQKTNNA